MAPILAIADARGVEGRLNNSLPSHNHPTNQLKIFQQNIMECLQILLRVPYSDCSGVVAWMKSKAHRITVAEHLEDDDVKTTHCHIAIEPQVSTEAIRKQLIKNSLGGEKHSIMTVCMATKIKYEFMLLSKYCIKGNPAYIRETTLGGDEVTELAKAWVNRVKKMDVDLTNHDTITGKSIPVSSMSEWDKLLHYFKKDTKHLEYKMPQVRKFIISYYLRQQKPPPRAGDTNRYTYALWAITHNKTDMSDVGEVDTHFSDSFGTMI